MHPECPELMRFVEGEIHATAFPHREHVRMAFEMLRRHDFAESVWLFSKSLRAMTARAGKPQAFNQTVTLAFLSLIAERMETAAGMNFEAFASANTELFDKATLARWYPRERLACEVTRRIFVLPLPAAVGAQQAAPPPVAGPPSP